MAREYLTAQQSSAVEKSLAWRRIVVTAPRVRVRAAAAPHIQASGQTSERVSVSGRGLATVSDGGQYETSSLVQPYYFTVSPTAGRPVPDQQAAVLHVKLLLTKPDFDIVYARRTICTFSDQYARILVPDPVYVPQPATNTNVAE